MMKMKMLALLYKYALKRCLLARSNAELGLSARGLAKLMELGSAVIATESQIQDIFADSQDSIFSSASLLMLMLLAVRAPKLSCSLQRKFVGYVGAVACYWTDPWTVQLFL
eukprot:4485649-Amphidinium_carterae.1